MNTMQFEFEEWVKSECLGFSLVCHGSRQGCLGCDEYEDEDLQLFWECWKQSRRALYPTMAHAGVNNE